MSFHVFYLEETISGIFMGIATYMSKDKYLQRANRVLGDQKKKCRWHLTLPRGSLGGPILLDWILLSRNHESEFIVEEGSRENAKEGLCTRELADTAASLPSCVN